MATITFIQPDGARDDVDIEDGRSIMEGARDFGISGIEAQCGGQCSCSTCHCYVDREWSDRLPPVEEPERSLLEFAWEPRENSRLTCQLTVSAALDGLVVHVPERQL